MPVLPNGVAVLARLKERIERGRFELPQLRAVDRHLMQIVADPSVDIGAVVEEIERSPSWR